MLLQLMLSCGCMLSLQTFLWLYSALWEENPHQDCLAVARDQ